MLTLRIKLTIALIAMSLVAIGLAGVTGQWLMRERFDGVVADRAFDGFASEIIEYYEAYGSWDAARAAEPFIAFQSRLRYGRGMSAGNRPAPPGGGRQGRGAGRRPPPRGAGQGPPPPAGGPRGPEAPTFVVADEAGTLLLNLGGRRAGDQLTGAELARARPVSASGRTIGVVAAVSRPVPTALEAQYLAAMQGSWIYSLVLAAGLALPIGVLLARRLTTPIRELTTAIRAMHGGELEQAVEVRSDDEIGQLSKAFNELSVNLASTYRELEASRTRLSAQADLLEQLSRTDDLTGLPNRRAFDDEVRRLCAQARRHHRPLTLAVADIDRFKQVNDSFSHAVGDAVLREVAALIMASIREGDLAARYGGEEFVIAFPETGLAEAGRLSDRLRQAVAGYDWSRIAPGLAITISLGLSDEPRARSFAEILDIADARLRDAKEQGRNQVYA